MTTISLLEDTVFYKEFHQRLQPYRWFYRWVSLDSSLAYVLLIILFIGSYKEVSLKSMLSAGKSDNTVLSFMCFGCLFIIKKISLVKVFQSRIKPTGCACGNGGSAH